MGNIGNNDFLKYNMWINYLETSINNEIKMKELTCITANIIVLQWTYDKDKW